VHVISNGRIGVHWPKTERLQRRFVEAIAAGIDDDAQLLDLLLDQEQPSDAVLPDTGVGIDLERLLAPVFVRGSAHYGTRASTLAYSTVAGGSVLCERTFAADGVVSSVVDWRYAAVESGLWLQPANHSLRMPN
jgi:uncharacterized protein with NRDE domain